MKTLPLLLLSVLFVGTALGQDDSAPAVDGPGATPAVDGPGATPAVDAPGGEETPTEGEPKEDCEEAWEYMEFLKNDIK